MKSKKSPKKTASLELSKQQAQFLYRLFSLYVPNGERHVSQALAESVGSVKTEIRVFEKIVKSCDELGVRHGKSAKDFGLLAVEQPKTTVVRVQVGEDEP